MVRGSEYLDYLEIVAGIEVDAGDYVTLRREKRGFLTWEEILTFSDIKIHRVRPTYACDATPKKGEQDCEEDE